MELEDPEVVVVWGGVVLVVINLPWDVGLRMVGVMLKNPWAVLLGRLCVMDAAVLAAIVEPI